MKKVFFILLGLLFAICSCVKESGTFDVQNNVDQDDQIIFVDPYRVTMDDLFEYLSITNTAKTKGDAAVKSIKPIKHDNDTVMYFIERNKGWEIISADKRAGVVMAYSNTGTESLEDLLSNPNINAWLSIRANMISLIRETNLVDENDNTEQWECLLKDIKHKAQTKTIIDGQPGWKRIGSTWSLVDSSSCPHQIETKWGQGYPWNTCVPYSGVNHYYRCYNGCGPVAFGQMLHWMHSKYGVPNYSYTSASCSGYSNRYGHNYSFVFSDSSSTAWAIMAKHYNDLNRSTNFVAFLLAKLGQILNAAYNINGLEYPKESMDGTSININTVTLNKVSSYFGINYDVDSYNDATILSNIMNYSKPSMIIVGSTLDTIAHVWIVDGYKYDRIQIDKYYIYDPNNTYDPESLIEEEEEESGEEYSYGIVHIPEGYDFQIITEYHSNYYYLMNWGYNGIGDNAFYAAESDWFYDDLYYDNRLVMITNFNI